MLALALVRKDLARMAADRRALVVNLALPLLLTFIMGLSFGGGVFGDAGISAIPVVLVGEEVPLPLRGRVDEAMAETGFVTTAWADSAEADRRVREGEAAAAVVLPDDFARRFFSGEELAVGVWKDPGSPLKAGIVEQILARMLARYQAGEAAYLALWPEDAYGEAGERDAWEDLLDGGFAEAWRRWRSEGGDPELRAAADRFARSLDHNVALTRALQDETTALRVHDAAAAGAAREDDDVNLFDYFLPSFSVFFLMFGVAASARDIHRERERGTLQRQLLTPLTGVQFLAGKWVSASVQGALQLLVLFLAGAALFRVNLGPDAWSLAVLAVLGSAAAGAFFVLMALLTPGEKVMDSVSTVVILVAAMVGGNMMPLEVMPAWAHVFGRGLFNYWLNLGLNEVIVRDRSLAAAPLPAAVLAGVTAACLAAALAVFLVRRRRGGLT